MIEAARDARLPHYEIQGHYLLGKHYLLTLEISEAKRHLRDAARLAGENAQYELQGFALDRLGVAYLEESMTDSALVVFQQALSIYRGNGLEHRAWASLQGISRVFGSRGNYSLAKKYGDEALTSSAGSTDPIARSVILDHMTSLTRDFQHLEDFAAYLDMYTESLGSVKTNINSSHKIGFYVTTEDPVQRLKDILSVIAALGTVPRITTILSYYHLGATYMELNDWSRAKEAFRTGLYFNEQVPTASAFRHALYNGLIEACEANGDDREALAWLKQKLISEDSLARIVNNTLINELQVKYETAQKEQTILSQEIELDRNALQRNLILIAVAILAGFAGFIFIVQRRKMQYERTIAGQKSSLQQQHILELEHQNKLLSLSAMIAGQEEERKRLANDIHDGLGGLLATVKIQFDRTREVIRDPVIVAEFDRTRKLLDETGSEVRRIAHNMMPHALMKMGLVPALEDLAGNIESANGLRVSLNCIEIVDQLPGEKEIVLYRIVQELCNNVIRHAKADKLLVQLSQHNGTFSLVVEDNGKGFVPGDVQNRGMGMESIASRVAYLNGTIDIDSQEGKGTSITIEFPAANGIITGNGHHDKIYHS